MPTCIYCQEEKEPKAFNREHVIQDGFGRFAGALTLHQMVCAQCNQVFGNSIDRELQREGPEGLERYRWGARNPSEISKFRYSQLTLRAKDAGDFSDARFELRADPASGGLVARLLPTISFAKKDGTGFVDFTEAQIASGEWRSNPDVDWQKGVKAFAEGKALDRLVQLLADQGIRPKLVRHFNMPFTHGQDITVQQSFAISDNMYRAISKIAFNYLAYREGAAFVLGSQFDPIRRFIRHGEMPGAAPVYTSDDLPFRFQGESDQRPVVHFVCVAPRHKGHSNLLGVVSLFGYLTHTVMLAENFEGPWPAAHAHLYNPKTGLVHPWKPGLPFSPQSGE